MSTLANRVLVCQMKAKKKETGRCVDLFLDFLAKKGYDC